MLYDNITSRNAILQAMAEFDRLGEADFLEKYGFGPSTKYDVYHEGNLYPLKAIISVAYANQFPSQGILSNDQCKNSKRLQKKYRDLGFEIRPKGYKPTIQVHNELVYRKELWDKILENGGPKNILTSIVNDLRVYYGGRGIWFDKERTQQIIETGVTVGLLHTGKHYADDLTDEGVLYHYPNTKNKGHDKSEIDATKAAKDLNLPIFVVTRSEGDDSKRDVYLGQVEDWTDDDKLFLISFIDQIPVIEQKNAESKPKAVSEAQFSVMEDQAQKYSISPQRPNQTRFRFQVFKRYGAQCAVCGIDFTEMIVAAHLHPKGKKGTDDPRNGLPLCANHHIAYDKHLFGINPQNYQIELKPNGPNKQKLKIEVEDLFHLRNLPEEEALAYNWKKFQKE